MSSATCRSKLKHDLLLIDVPYPVARQPIIYPVHTNLSKDPIGTYYALCVVFKSRKSICDKVLSETNCSTFKFGSREK